MSKRNFSLTLVKISEVKQTKYFLTLIPKNSYNIAWHDYLNNFFPIQVALDLLLQ